MAFPYLIPITVNDSSSNALSDIRVIVRNQSTDETLTQNTDSSGEVVFDAANFTSGYTYGDIVEYTVNYQSEEGSGTVTITQGQGGASAQTLTLSSVPSAPQLRYFSPDDFFTYFDLSPFNSNDDTTGIKTKRIVLMGEGVEADIDSDTNSRFDGSNTVTQEYHDVQDEYQKEFFLRKGPVQSITTFQTNVSGEDDAASWQTLTEDTDFETNTDTGRIKLTTISNLPATGVKQVRVTYTYGKSSVPAEIKELAIIETGRKMFGSNFIKQRIGGVETERTEVESFENYRQKVINKYRWGGISNT